MKMINISNPEAIDLAVSEIHHHPILVQFPAVFVLLAAPTLKGAQQLDDCKTRLDGKNYGTAIGSLRKFLSQASPQQLPEQFNCTAHFNHLKGTFIRLPFRSSSFHSKTIRNGTHQGLLLTGTYVKLFKKIEASFESYPPEEIWDHRNYCAPLCTSCNISGHPDGSIVAFDKALEFANNRGINLFITNRRPAREKGSYPIFGFEKDRVSVHREGPGLNMFKERIPAGLRTW